VPQSEDEITLARNGVGRHIHLRDDLGGRMRHNRFHRHTGTEFKIRRLHLQRQGVSDYANALRRRARFQRRPVQREKLWLRSGPTKFHIHAELGVLAPEPATHSRGLVW